MTKIIYKDEEGFIEVFDSSRIYIDPNTPNSINIISYAESVKIILTFSDVEESESFINLLFECDKVNLLEICNDNPDIRLETEEINYYQEMMGYLDDIEEDDYDVTEDSDYDEQ